MKLKLLLVAIFLALLAVDVDALDKPRKHKKFRKHRKPTLASESLENAEGQDEFKMMEQDEAEEQLREIEEKARTQDLQRENDRAREQAETPEDPEGLRDNRVPIPDPCSKVHCGAGRICDISKEGEPQCICIPECPVELDSRRKVCSNHNETWTSDCAVYQQRCWCDSDDDRCKGEEFKHLHIEYYGECRQMPECSKEEMSDFPRRMRDWLFNIMRDLADRKELTPHYLKMEREAESNMTRRWTNAAIWKWCDLDGHPPDRSVSRHELFPIRAPLMSLEHCIAPFLNSCDVDDNHRISLKEWGDCLELEEEDLEDKCDEVLLG